METREFDFPYPMEAIAQSPVTRGRARMLAIRRGGQRIHDGVANFGAYIEPGDALVVNSTRVFKARLRGRTQTGGAVEMLLVHPLAGGLESPLWSALLRPAKRLKAGGVARFGADLRVHCLREAREAEDLAEVRLEWGAGKLMQIVSEVGEVPLPPYIRRAPTPRDDADYQSVFALQTGSCAAPTASLHFGEEDVAAIRRGGVHIIPVTLHVGPGTFRPVRALEVKNHPMHAEWMEVSPESASAINGVRSQNGRLFALGTTVARALESCPLREDRLEPFTGWSDKFIYPGYRWRVVDCLLTNFHWPRSTLFMLVCSLLGIRETKAAYAEAIAKGYRLFSYGDAMLIH